jgi:hypothetical protein
MFRELADRRAINRKTIKWKDHPMGKHPMGNHPMAGPSNAELSTELLKSFGASLGKLLRKNRLGAFYGAEGRNQGKRRRCARTKGRNPSQAMA